jgi:hypothetical protein
VLVEEEGRVERTRERGRWEFRLIAWSSAARFSLPRPLFFPTPPTPKQVRGLVRQHIESFDHFVNRGIKAVVRARGNHRVTCEADPNWHLRYTDVYVG